MPKSKKETKNKKVKSSGKGEKFADMSTTAVIVDEEALEKGLQEQPKTVKKITRRLRTRGKKYEDTKQKIDKNKIYSPKEALEFLKTISFPKFDSSVEVHLNVSEKGLRGEATLPYFKGKAPRVAIFDDKLIEKIKKEEISFDVLLATPADMPKITPLAKILGPKGLLPNPKNGTLVPDPQKAIEKFSGNALHYRTEKDFPLIHTVIGKISQPIEELAANFEALIKAVNPKNIKKVYIKSTMSPSLKVSF